MRDDGTPVFGCPTNAVPGWTLSFLQQFPLSEQGVMLVDGGIGDQPYFWMWAMGVIGSEIASIRMKEAEEEKRAREREARMGGRR